LAITYLRRTDQSIAILLTLTALPVKRKKTRNQAFNIEILLDHESVLISLMDASKVGSKQTKKKSKIRIVKN
tara:strand:- start:277 stop:492 length:216 start_codon:yes stop_codon:yes gene_type:complete